MTHIRGLSHAQREQLLNEPAIDLDTRHDLFTEPMQYLRDKMPSCVPESLLDEIKLTLIQLSVNQHSWRHRPTCFKK